MKFQGFEDDAGFDGVALASRGLAIPRLIVAVLVIATVTVTIGRLQAAIWGAALLASEVWSWLATAPHAAGKTLLPRHRLNYLASAMALNWLWLALSILYWLAPDRGSAFIALLIWASLLLNAISHAFRSWYALLIFSIPTALVMVGMPVASPRFEGSQHFLAVFGLVVFAAYAVISAHRNVTAAQSLAAIRIELEAQTRAAQAASEAKSSFLAMMSHELRTPMNGVLGMAHALERTDLTPRQREYVTTLLRSGGGLMTILNDVLDLAKIEAGKFDIEHQPFDLHQKLAKVTELWLPAAAEKGLSLTCEIAPDAPHWVMGDGARLRQILLNLLSNAIKFTSTGEVHLTLVPTAAPGVLAFTVADTGPGMDEETQGRLFKGFTQADSSVGRRFGGTGLGLAISRELAQLMGGDITLESRSGAGSRFTLALPLPPTPPPTLVEKPGLELALEGPIRALVVDDNLTNQEVARALLNALGVTVATASGGAEALTILETASFDIVFMDIHMPGMSGIEALVQIRAGPAAIASLPIFALTADAMAGERERLLSLGFDGYLSKPIEPAALVAALGA
jgi:signal transduction histidine kinase